VAWKKGGSQSETPRALQAFQDFDRMGTTRSLPALAERYRTATVAVPTTSLGVLKMWSSMHEWQRRIKDRERRVAAENAAQITMAEANLEARKRDRVAGFEESLVQKGQKMENAATIQILQAVQKGRPIPGPAVTLLLASLRMQARGYRIPWEIDRRELTGEGGGEIKTKMEVRQLLAIVPAEFRDRVLQMALEQSQSRGASAASNGVFDAAFEEVS
jgi:hypothetical protein